jgi:hypothetical protein
MAKTKHMQHMTDQEVLDELQKETPLNLARREFSSWCAKIEQAGQQKKPLGSIERRRMEFEAVKNILARYGMSVLTKAQTEFII